MRHPTATVVHVDFKGPVPSEEASDEPLFTADNPAEAEISARSSISTARARRARRGTRSLPSTHRASSTSPAMRSAFCRRTIRRWRSRCSAAVGLDGDAALAAKLVQRFDITTLSRPFIDGYAKLTGRKDVAALLTEEGAFARFSEDRQLVDLFETYPEKLNADQLTKLLRPLPGRLYSVASSLKAHQGEAHLLVGAVRWSSHGKPRKGVTSTFLADRRRVGDTRQDLYPAEPALRPSGGCQPPIIMIGAGTGVAPYRGFIEERAETDAPGKSWLFFGERNFSFDFLYQLEWQDYLASGALSRIDVAFSRDQPEKIYVQTRLWERRRGNSRVGSRKAPTSMCAATRRAWRKTSMPPLVKILAGAKERR